MNSFIFLIEQDSNLSIIYAVVVYKKYLHPNDHHQMTQNRVINSLLIIDLNETSKQTQSLNNNKMNPSKKINHLNTFHISKNSEDEKYQKLWNLLYQLCSEENLKEIEKVLLHNEMDNVFFVACQVGNLNVIKYLVSKGANIHAEYKGEDGKMYKGFPLIICAEEGHLDVIKYFDTLGIDIHSNDEKAFKSACEYKQLDVIHYLVKRGVDIHTNGPNRSSLKEFGFLCSLPDHVKMAKYFVSQGADIHFNNEFALKNACEVGKLEMVRFLVSQGANIHCYEMINNARIEEFPLIVACEKGHLNVVQFLVEGCPSVGIKTSADITIMKNAPLGIACEHGNVQVAKYLISKGANPKDRPQILEFACEKGHLECVKYLVSQGADIHANDSVCFLLACKGGQLNVVQFLVEGCLNFEVKGVGKCRLSKPIDPHVHNDLGFNIACKMGHKSVAKYLAQKCGKKYNI